VLRLNTNSSVCVNGESRLVFVKVNHSLDKHLTLHILACFFLNLHYRLLVCMGGHFLILSTNIAI
jgi:hypothetical protein